MDNSKINELMQTVFDLLARAEELCEIIENDVPPSVVAEYQALMKRLYNNGTV